MRVVLLDRRRCAGPRAQQIIGSGSGLLVGHSATTPTLTLSIAVLPWFLDYPPSVES